MSGQRQIRLRLGQQAVCSTAFRRKISTTASIPPKGGTTNKLGTVQRAFFSTALSVALFFAISSNSLGESSRLNDTQLFDVGHIVEVQIKVDEDDWDQLRFQRRELMDCFVRDEPPQSPFTYVKADIVVDGHAIKNVGIRKKGFLGSLNDRRPSLKIKFSEFERKHKTHPPIEGIDRLTLNNNNQDPAGASQSMAYRLFHDMGLPASRCNLAHVTVNGKNLGIYSNVESVRKPMLRRQFGVDHGGLFEGTVTDFYDESVTRFEAKNSRSPLSLIGAVANVLDEESLDLQRLNALVDVDAFVKFWAAESLLGFWDGYCNDQNNFFVYVDPEESRFHFMPWGMDCAFQDNMPLPPFFIRPQFVYTRGRLANRLYRNNVVREKYHQQMKRMLDEHWDEEDLLARVDAIEALGGPYNTRGISYAQSLRNIRRFIKSRRRKLTAEMEKGFVLDKPARKCPYSEVILEASGSFQTEWYGRVPDKDDLGQPALTLRVRGKAVEFRQLAVYGFEGKRRRAGKGSPTITFRGKESNGKVLTLNLDVKPESFATRDKDIPIRGALIQGKPGWLGTRSTRLTGTLRLEEAEMRNGARLKGSFRAVGRGFVDPN